MVTALASPRKGALHLTRVVTLDQFVSEGEREALIERAKEDLRATVKNLHEGLEAPALSTLPLSLTWSIATDNDVAGGIIRVAESGEDAEGACMPARCDLIAMTTHGYSGLQRWTLGSITERVLHATELPLLIVPPERQMR